MSGNDRIIILFISTVGFWVFTLWVCSLLVECLVGSISNFLIAAFWYHLWRLEKEKQKK